MKELLAKLREAMPEWSWSALIEGTCAADLGTVRLSFVRSTKLRDDACLRCGDRACRCRQGTLPWRVPVLLLRVVVGREVVHAAHVESIPDVVACFDRAMAVDVEALRDHRLSILLSLAC